MYVRRTYSQLCRRHLTIDGAIDKHCHTLGPLLFIVYLNDIPISLKYGSRVYMCADDTGLLYISSS